MSSIKVATMKCPSCGSKDRFLTEVTVSVFVCPQEALDAEIVDSGMWSVDSEAECECYECFFSGKAKQFAEVEP